MQIRVALAKIVDNSPRSTPSQIKAALIAKIISLLLEKFFEFTFVALNVRADNRRADDFAFAVDKNRRGNRFDIRHKIQKLFVGNDVYEIRARFRNYFLRLLNLLS